MLKLPSFMNVGELTIFADDTVWNRFYVIPGIPRLRFDRNGQPVFLMAKYRFGDDARENDPNLPRGGGYVAFDVQLAALPEQLAEVEQKLNAWVVEEHARRGSSDPPLPGSGGPAPKAELGTPTWTKGIARLQTTRSEHLISSIVAEQPASLLAGNAAVFNLDLTEHGADFMYELLLEPWGSGRSDITPFQVIYELAMMARMPAVTIKIEADSKRIHTQWGVLIESQGLDSFTSSQFHNDIGISGARLVEEGSVKVTVNSGDAKLDSEELEELRTYALELFETMMEERFLQPADDDMEELEFDDDDAGGGGSSGPAGPAPASGDSARDPGWAAILFKDADYQGDTVEVLADIPNLKRDYNYNDVLTSVRLREGHQVLLYEHVDFGGRMVKLQNSRAKLDGWANNRVSSVRVHRAPDQKLKFRGKFNVATMDLDITLEQSRIVEWPVVAPASMQTFFGGVDPLTMRKHVVELTLDAFSTLGLTVQVSADFENEPIAFVRVEVVYKGFDAFAGGRQEKNWGHDFFADTEPQLWDPAVIGKERGYSYRWRVHYKGQAEGSEFTDWTWAEGRSLTVGVSDPGKLDVEVSAAALNFDIVRTVKAELSYRDRREDVERVDQVFMLDKANPNGHWEHRIYKPVREEIEANFTYYLVNDRVIEGRRTKTRAKAIVVPPPAVDILNVQLIPGGDWEGVSQVIVTMVYADRSGQSFDKSFRFATRDEFATWEVLIEDPSARAYRYKWIVTFDNGTLDETDWIDGEGDGTIAINVGNKRDLVIDVQSRLVDFDETPIVNVQLTHPRGGTTLSFSEPGSQRWSVPLEPGDSREYQYELEYFLPSGQGRKEAAASSDSNILVLPSLEMRESGTMTVRVRGDLIDYTKTPIVDVTLELLDGSSAGPDVLTLSADAKRATWEIRLSDRAERTFRYVVTYFLPDGTSVPGDTAETSVPSIVVRSYSAA